MINLGLSSAELKLFQESLYQPPGYQLKVTIQILDLNHNRLADVSSRLLDGQVNKSFWDIVTSNAQISLMDPDNQVGFDTVNPSEGALYMDRMIKIVYSVYSDRLPKWVDVPLFCGPVTDVNRDDAILNIECQGKESFYVAPSMAWTTKTYPTSMKLVTAVKDLLGTKGGETKFDLPEWTRTLRKDYSLKVETPIWDKARDFVGSRLVHQLFYDGRGYLRLRNCPTSPTFTFTEPHITSIPKIGFKTEEVRNTARVLGATPEGKAQIIASAELPSSDASSSTSLGRGNPIVKRRLVERVEDPDLKTQAAAEAQADETLESVSLENVTFDFDSFPIPHLEQGDVFAIATRDFGRNLRAKQFTVPLKPSDSAPQTNGTYRRLTPLTRKQRKR
jgi:hypothetical protein